MSKNVSGLLYLCNPLANKDCNKLTCFWTAWQRNESNSLNDPFPCCYKTCYEEFAARDIDGKPIVWPEGEETLRKWKQGDDLKETTKK